MGARTFPRALLWAFATHCALVGALATKTRHSSIVAVEPESIVVETIELAPARVEPPSAPPASPVTVTATTRAPRANRASTPVAARPLEAHAELTAEAPDNVAAPSDLASNEDATGPEAARPRTAAASSRAPALAHGPMLLGTGGCRQYFPHDAKSEEGTVTVAIDVSTAGTSAGTHIVNESPSRNGFGEAAARCATSLHFAPAIDESGVPIRAVATLELHFARLRRRDTLSLR